MAPFMVNEIRRLSQEEGLNDKEMADIFGCSRATVNRTRQKHKIPSANLHNRKDKTYCCTFCAKTVTIRRVERKKRYCDDCRESLGIGKKQ